MATSSVESARRRVALQSSISSSSILSTTVGLLILTVTISFTPTAATVPKQPVNPESLRKWVQPLRQLPVVLAYDPRNLDPVKPYEMKIGMWETFQEFHPDFPEKTKVYAYGVTQEAAVTPGPILVARRFQPIVVEWTNNLPAEHFLPIDYTLVEEGYPREGSHKGIGTTVHLHGGESSPSGDGHPYTWYTNPQHCDRSKDAPICTGSAYRSNKHRYENDQLPSVYLFHDHAFGITARNVYAGLVGGYQIVDPRIDNPLRLPSGNFEVILVIQDKVFTPEGQLVYPKPPLTDPPSRFHPVWIPELFGSVPVVNGQIWPYLQVERCQYRFHFIQGSNARFYKLSIPGQSNMALPMWVISTDGGYLESPVKVFELLFPPAARRDIIIDFSLVPKHVTEIILENSAPAPFPGGEPTPKNSSVGAILKFIVKPSSARVRGCRKGPLPRRLINLPTLLSPSGVPSVIRYNTLMENTDPVTDTLINILISNTTFKAPPTEIVQYMSHEEWNFINISPDSHPMHLHLVQFRIKNRQAFDVDAYVQGLCQIAQTVDIEGRPVGPIRKNLPSCLRGAPTGPFPEEDGLLDTVMVPPGQITRINVRFSSQKYLPEKPFVVAPFKFDPTAFPGYVWHCHIIEHEDNEMMRPLLLYNTHAGRSSVATPFQPSLGDLARFS